MTASGSRKDSVDVESYNAAFAEAWELTAEENARNQAAITSIRRRYRSAALLGLLTGVVLIAVGAVLWDGDITVALILLAAGLVVAAGAVWFGYRNFNRVPATDTTAATAATFVTSFLSGYLKRVHPQLMITDFAMQNARSAASFSERECRERAHTMVEVGKETDCANATDYLFATGDIALMFGTKPFEQLNLTTSTRMAMAYKGKRLTLFDALVVRTEALGFLNLRRTDGEHKVITCFRGMIAATEHVARYPYTMGVAAKGSSFRMPGAIAPAYALASDEFNAQMGVYVGKDDGVALRMAFQPRMIARFCDLQNPGAMLLCRHDPGHTNAVYATGTGLSMNGYDSRMFIRSKTAAYEMLSGAAIPFFQSVADVLSLIDCDFLQ